MKLNHFHMSGILATVPVKVSLGDTGHSKYEFRLLHHHLPWKGDSYGEERALFFTCQCGEAVGKALSMKADKGDHLWVEGMILTHGWRKPDGTTAVVTYLEVTKFDAHESKKNAAKKGEEHEEQGS